MTNLVLLLCIIAAFFQIPLGGVTTVINAGTSYYVDNTCTHNGNGLAAACAASNGAPGPFNSLANAQSGITGDQHGNNLLFKAAETFAGPLTIGAYGTSAGQFVVGAYGTGANPIIDGAATPFAISVNSEPYVTVENLTVQNAASNDHDGGGIFLPDGSNYAIIQNNTAQNNEGYGIYLARANNSSILNNTINTVTGSTTRGDAIAIEGGALCASAISGFTVSGNTIEGSLGRQGISVTYTSGGIISGNTITYNGGLSAIDVEPDSGCSVSGATISNNDITIANSAAYAGVNATTGGGGTISGLTISGNTINLAGYAAYGIGFASTSGANLISGNTMTNLGSGAGVLIGDGVVMIQNNNVTASSATSGKAFYFHNGTSATGTVVGNYASAGYGIMLSQVGTTVNAYGNRLIAQTSGTGVGIESINGNATDVLNAWGNVLINWNYGLFGGSSSTGGTNNFFNNSVIVSSATTSYGARFSGTGTNTFENNVVYSDSTGIVIFVRYDSSTSLPTCDYNFYYAPNASTSEWIAAPAYPTTLSAWQADVGSDANAEVVDPLFVDAATYDLELQSSSPARDHGANLGTAYEMAIAPGSTWPSGVRFLNQNNHGTGWEVGAYVYG